MNKYFLFTALFFSMTIPVLSQVPDPDFLASLSDELGTDLTGESDKLGKAGEIAKIHKLDTSQESNKKILDEIQLNIDDLRNKISQDTNSTNAFEELRRFGETIFSSIQTSFMPINLPNLDSNYILDYGDILRIQVTGKLALDLEVDVNRDGSVSIKNVGTVYVAGLSLAEASKAIVAKIKGHILGTDAFVSLVNIRDIQVILLGAVKFPGTYTVSGSSNALHVLNVSGGIADYGSFRNIRITRNDKLISNIDLYDIFIFGKNTALPKLRSGDVIYVSPKISEVAISGGVNNPMIYEVVDGETIEDVIAFAGGFSKLNKEDPRIIISNRANLSTSNNLYQIFSMNNYKNVIAKDNDNIYVPFYKQEFIPSKSVTISGMVRYPGTYFIEEGDKLSKVIELAGGLKNNAYTFAGTLFRNSAKIVQENFYRKTYQDTISFLSANLGNQTAGMFSASSDGALKIILEELRSRKPLGRVIAEFDPIELRNNPLKDILLESGDQIHIPAFTDYIFALGEFNNPGVQTYNNNFSLTQYIDQAGGFSKFSDKSILLIDPNGISREIKPAFFGRFIESNEIYPGSVILASREIGKIRGLNYATTVAPVISSLAISLASLNSIVDN